MRHLLAAGSAAGRQHLLAERPNQDAFALREGPWGAAAVVCDGCGSEPKSGLGAALGAALAAGAIEKRLASEGALDLKGLEGDILGGILRVSLAAGLDLREHFLFTVVGAAFSGERAVVFACGDGVAAVDGTVTRLGPYPGNAPPYLAYALEGANVSLKVLYDGTAQSVLVGTDGAADGDLAPLLAGERFFANHDLLRRTLRRQRLADDATVALIRRVP